MCIYNIFNFLCGGQKLKITSPCEHAFTNYQGIQFCRMSPQAHVHDGVPRNYSTPTHGPGICSNTHCRDLFGMLPYELSKKNKACDLVEDDSEFDMSPEACADREARWYRMLSTDHQLECLSTTFPVSTESMSQYARVWLYLADLPPNEWAAHFESACNANPDELIWQELNPRYMSQFTLQTVTKLHLLPAWVTDTNQTAPDQGHRNSNSKGKGKGKQTQVRTTTPYMPLYGPFKVGDHICKPAVGFCKTCGHYHGKECRRTPFEFHKSDWAKASADFNAQDPATQMAIQELAWSALTHEKPAASVPFHGNNFERQAAAAFANGQFVGTQETAVAVVNCLAAENYVANTTNPDMMSSDRQQPPNGVFTANSQQNDLCPEMSNLDQFDHEMQDFFPHIPTDPYEQNGFDASMNQNQVRPYPPMPEDQQIGFESSIDPSHVDPNALTLGDQQFDIPGMSQIQRFNREMDTSMPQNTVEPSAPISGGDQTDFDAFLAAQRSHKPYMLQAEDEQFNFSFSEFNDAGECMMIDS